MGIGIAYLVIAALLWMACGAAFQKGETSGGVFVMVLAFFISWMTVYCFTSKDQSEKEV